MSKKQQQKTSKSHQEDQPGPSGSKTAGSTSTHDAQQIHSTEYDKMKKAIQPKVVKIDYEEDNMRRAEKIEDEIILKHYEEALKKKYPEIKFKSGEKSLEDIINFEKQR